MLDNNQKNHFFKLAEINLKMNRLVTEEHQSLLSLYIICLTFFIISFVPSIFEISITEFYSDSKDYTTVLKIFNLIVLIIYQILFFMLVFTITRFKQKIGFMQLDYSDLTIISKAIKNLQDQLVKKLNDLKGVYKWSFLTFILMSIYVFILYMAFGFWNANTLGMLIWVLFSFLWYLLYYKLFLKWNDFGKSESFLKQYANSYGCTIFYQLKFGETESVNKEIFRNSQIKEIHKKAMKHFTIDGLKLFLNIIEEYIEDLYNYSLKTTDNNEKIDHDHVIGAKYSLRRKKEKKKLSEGLTYVVIGAAIGFGVSETLKGSYQKGVIIVILSSLVYAIAHRILSSEAFRYFTSKSNNVE